MKTKEEAVANAFGVEISTTSRYRLVAKLIRREVDLCVTAKNRKNHGGFSAVTHGQSEMLMDMQRLRGRRPGMGGANPVSATLLFSLLIRCVEGEADTSAFPVDANAVLGDIAALRFWLLGGACEVVNKEVDERGDQRGNACSNVPGALLGEP